MSCANLRFGSTNRVPLAALSSNIAPVTPLEWMQEEHRAELVRWVNPVGDIVIDMTYDEPQVGEYVAILGSNLLGRASVRVELFAEAGDESDLLDMPVTPTARPIPAGEFRAGIDKFGAVAEADSPPTFLYWFPRPILHRAARLTIEHDGRERVELRMVLCGEKLEVERNFEFGAEASFVTAPDPIQVSSGTFVPSGEQDESRRFTINLPMMTDRDRLRLRQMERRLLGQPFIVSGYPDSTGWQYHDHNFLAVFAGALGYGHRAPGLHMADAITLLEV